MAYVRGEGLTNRLLYARWDGVTWQKHTGNPVLGPGDPGDWDSAYRGQIALIEDGGLYKMWYSGGAFSGPWQVGYATSADGLVWDIYAGNPFLKAEKSQELEVGFDAALANDRVGLGVVYFRKKGIDQILTLRPANGMARYRFGPEGCYLCGASAHPGGDVMGAAGRNAARQLLRDGGA